MQAEKARKINPKKQSVPADGRPRVTVQLRPEVQQLLDKAREDGRTPTWLINKSLRALLTKMGYAKSLKQRGEFKARTA